jgi:Zn-dependent protease with chaperone function
MIKLIQKRSLSCFLFLKSGHIIVYKGLLDYVDSDDELAGVLGHEISHAILQHTVK